MHLMTFMQKVLLTFQACDKYAAYLKPIKEHGECGYLMF